MSLTQSEIDRMRARALIRDNGVVSAYVRSLLSRDEAGMPIEYPADCLDMLGRTYAGARARDLGALLRGADQPNRLARLLEELADLLRAGFAPESLHLAEAAAISAAPVSLSALRYPPRVPRSRVTIDYPPPRPREHGVNEPT